MKRKHRKNDLTTKAILVQPKRQRHEKECKKGQETMVENLSTETETATSTGNMKKA